MTTAAELHALQETDLAMDSAVARLSETEAQLGETEELVAARELVEQRRGETHQIQERQKALDWDAEEVRQKALGIEGKLYGGTIKNPKELEDLQADLSSLRSQLRKREDALLEVMLELEDAETALKEAETALADIESGWKAEQASFAQTQAVLNREIQALEA